MVVYAGVHDPALGGFQYDEKHSSYIEVIIDPEGWRCNKHSLNIYKISVSVLTAQGMKNELSYFMICTAHIHKGDSLL